MQILAVQEIVGSQATNFLNVYKIAKDGIAAVLQYGPLNIATGANGSPGGNTAGTHAFTKPLFGPPHVDEQGQAFTHGQQAPVEGYACVLSTNIFFLKNLCVCGCSGRQMGLPVDRQRYFPV